MAEQQFLRPRTRAARLFTLATAASLLASITLHAATPIFVSAQTSGPRRIFLPIASAESDQPVTVPVVDVHDHASHVHADSAPLTAETEQALELMQRPGHGMRIRGAGEGAQANSHIVGQWSGVQQWPVVAIHAALLPDGNVMTFDSVGDNPTESYSQHTFTRAMVWNPATNAITRIDSNTGQNLFCAGFAKLPDGRLFLAGGNLNSALQGLSSTHLFDPVNNSWTRTAEMSRGGRWYPSVTPLANGEMLITEGGPDVPEIRAVNGTLRALTSASLNMALYPWLHVSPQGGVTHLGPEAQMRTLNTAGAGSWSGTTTRDTVVRDYGSFAMYDIGRTLISGGNAAVRTAVVVNSNTTPPTVATTNPMATGRRQHNLTVLADGSVLATGGLSSGAGLVDLNAPVYTAELWQPTTGLWTTMSSMQVTRQYHSMAMLLLDGRVLSAGGGICGTCQAVGYLAKSAEIFSPPYLFKKDGSGQLAPRPALNNAPRAAQYGQAFDVTSPDAARITKAGLIRLSSVTHSVNFEQRYVPLSYTRTGTVLRLTAPANANIAPPGQYMLVLVDSDGVPSIGAVLRVQSEAVLPPSAPTLTSASPADGSVTLAWTASVGASGYTVRYGTVSGSYAQSLDAGSATAATISGLTNNTTYYFVVAARNAALVGANSNELNARPAPTVVFPAAPTLASATAGNAKVTLAWSTIANATSYVIRWGDSSGAYPNSRNVGDVTSAEVAGLSNGTPYFFVVAAANTAGTGANSNQLSATPQAPVSGTRLTIYDEAISADWDDWSFQTLVNPAASAPVRSGARALGVTYQAGWVQFVLHHKRYGGIDSTPYNKLRFWVHGGATGGQTVYVNANGNSIYDKTFTAVANTWTQVEFPLTDLGAQAALFELRFGDSEGGAQPTYFIDDLELIGDTSPPTPPAAPTLISALPGDGSVALTWSTVGNATGYTVRYGTAANALNSTLNAGVATRVQVGGLTNGTAYWFAVVASNSAGAGAASNTLSATPTAGSGASLALYDDVLVNDWQDWSDGMTRNFANTAPVRTGVRSLAATNTEALGSLRFRHRVFEGVSTAGYTRLRFWVHGGSAGNQTVWVSLNSNFNAQVTVNAVANQWTLVDIPLSGLGSPAAITLVQLTDATFGVQPTFYIDDMALGN